MYDLELRAALAKDVKVPYGQRWVRVAPAALLRFAITIAVPAVTIAVAVTTTITIAAVATAGGVRVERPALHLHDRARVVEHVGKGEAVERR